MGGRAAEELVCETITTGASNDIEQATRIARSMVSRYGMSDQYGMMALETNQNAYLGGDSSLLCSPETSAGMDREVQRIIADAYERAITLIRKDMGKMHELAEYLIEKETITGEEFIRILTH